jgi:hypothetical protein
MADINIDKNSDIEMINLIDKVLDSIVIKDAIDICYQRTLTSCEDIISNICYVVFREILLNTIIYGYSIIKVRVTDGFINVIMRDDKKDILMSVNYEHGIINNKVHIHVDKFNNIILVDIFDCDFVDTFFNELDDM